MKNSLEFKLQIDYKLSTRILSRKQDIFEIVPEWPNYEVF